MQSFWVAPYPYPAVHCRLFVENMCAVSGYDWTGVSWFLIDDLQCFLSPAAYSRGYRFRKKSEYIVVSERFLISGLHGLQSACTNHGWVLWALSGWRWKIISSLAIGAVLLMQVHSLEFCNCTFVTRTPPYQISIICNYRQNIAVYGQCAMCGRISNFLPVICLHNERAVVASHVLYFLLSLRFNFESRMVQGSVWESPTPILVNLKNSYISPFS